MSASSRRPTSRFQSGIAAMYDCTGASPSPFAICGLPPERYTTPFAPAFEAFFDATFFVEDIEERAFLVEDLAFAFLLGFGLGFGFGFALPVARTGPPDLTTSTRCRPSARRCAVRY